jgi:hypothetical protein
VIGKHGLGVVLLLGQTLFSVGATKAQTLLGIATELDRLFDRTFQSHLRRFLLATNVGLLQSLAVGQ